MSSDDFNTSHNLVSLNRFISPYKLYTQEEGYRYWMDTTTVLISK